ncbi:MAG: cystatin domain-containing protein [Pyrinomonadaceae bacterium]
MRKTLIATIMFAAAAIFCTSQANAQGRPILGGYKEIPKTNANAKKAALWAVSAEAKRSEKEIEFISVVKAEQQTVAGTNFRMCLKVSDSGAEGQDAAEVFVKVVVNLDLKNNYKLLSWEASDCGEDEDGGDAAPSAVASAN